MHTVRKRSYEHMICQHLACHNLFATVFLTSAKPTLHHLHYSTYRRMTRIRAKEPSYRQRIGASHIKERGELLNDHGLEADS